VRTTARFYDIPVAGSRVAFVLDCSASMSGSNIESAVAELTGAVKSLRSSQRFGVVRFEEKVWTWREDLVRATPAQKWAFVRSLDRVETQHYTNIFDALERAFGWAGQGRFAVAPSPGLDEVFLLSDGEPNRGRLREPDSICARVAQWNERARVRLHAVALGEVAKPLLLRLAGENGGTCVVRVRPK